MRIISDKVRTGIRLISVDLPSAARGPAMHFADLSRLLAAVLRSGSSNWQKRCCERRPAGMWGSGLGARGGYSGHGGLEQCVMPGARYGLGAHRSELAEPGVEGQWRSQLGGSGAREAPPRRANLAPSRRCRGAGRAQSLVYARREGGSRWFPCYDQFPRERGLGRRFVAYDQQALSLRRKGFGTGSYDALDHAWEKRFLTLPLAHAGRPPIPWPWPG